EGIAECGWRPEIKRREKGAAVPSLSPNLGYGGLGPERRSSSSLHSHRRFSPLPGFGTRPFARECASRRFAPRSSRLSHEPHLHVVRTASAARPGRMPGRYFFPQRKRVWLVSQRESKRYRSKPRLSFEIGPEARPEKTGDLRGIFPRRG